MASAALISRPRLAAGKVVYWVLWCSTLHMLSCCVSSCRLLENNIVRKVRSASSPFWHTKCGEGIECADNFIDAAFVDDEAIVLIVSSPRVLQRAIQVLSNVLPDTFRRFRLDINWAPGKTEGLLALRGKHASDVRESYRFNEGPRSSEHCRRVQALGFCNSCKPFQCSVCPCPRLNCMWCVRPIGVQSLRQPRPEIQSET